MFEKCLATCIVILSVVLRSMDGMDMISTPKIVSRNTFAKENVFVKLFVSDFKSEC